MPRPKLVPIQAAEAQFEIERGIPLPPPKAGQGAVSKYPFAAMRVGDSLFFLGRTQSSVLTPANKWSQARKLDVKFATRKVDGGVRIWRIS